MTVGLKELVIGSKWLGDKIAAEANQASASVDILRHGDWDFPFRIQKSGNKISVDFVWIVNDKIGINPSRTIILPRPHITGTRLRNCNIFYSVIRVSPWHGITKS